MNPVPQLRDQICAVFSMSSLTLSLSQFARKGLTQELYLKGTKKNPALCCTWVRVEGDRKGSNFHLGGDNYYAQTQDREKG